MNARPRRNAPKPFVTGGIITNPNRPLIVPPLQQQLLQFQEANSQQQQVQQQIQKQPQQQPEQQKPPQQAQQKPPQQEQQKPQQQQQQQQKPLQQQIKPIQQNTNNEPMSIDVKPIPVIGAGVNANSNGTNDDGMNYELGEEEINKKAFFKKFLGSRKKASVRAKERRLRQNKRLRKVLVPKNALMALNELRGIKISEFNVITRTGGGFVCQVTVNNIQYEGFGISKASAKSDACEKALRDLFISKMLQKPSKISTDDTDSISTTATTETANPNVAPVEDKTDDEDIEMKICENTDEYDLPMINLASYALFKLFCEWENEGFEIPEFRSNSSLSNTSQQGDTKKAPTIRTELPPNWESLHPAMLLCTMRPGSAYTDLGSDGLPPNQVQRVGITIDGEHFIGVGRSKKAARKDAAINACNKIFATTFPKDQ